MRSNTGLLWVLLAQPASLGLSACDTHDEAIGSYDNVADEVATQELTEREGASNDASKVNSQSTLGVQSTSELDPWYEDCGGIHPWYPEDIYDDFDTTAIRYNGYWRYHTGIAGDLNGTDHYSKESGATATFIIPVTKDFGWVAIGYAKAPNYGVAKVYWDDQYVETINLYSPTPQYQCERGYYRGYMPGAEHRLKVRVEGRSGGGNGAYIFLDYFIAGW